MSRDWWRPSKQDAPRAEFDLRGPPVGRAFVAFLLSFIVLVGLVWLESTGSTRLGGVGSPELGMAATTTILIAAAATAYRWQASRRLGVAVPIVIVFLAPAAAWSWFTLVRAQAIESLMAELVGAGIWTLALVMFVRALSSDDWMEVFAGLGSLGVGLAISAVQLDPQLASSSVFVPLLASAGGAACMYGILVDVEVAEHRSLKGLLASRARVEQEIARTEDVLHDLRSGLLAIEAAIAAGGDSELSLALQSETARLRQLTLVETPHAETFDLVPEVRALVVARQASGVDVRLKAPTQASVRADRSSVLAVIENLLSNAVRHGTTPISIEIKPQRARLGGCDVRVVNQGPAPSLALVEEAFERGASNHPDGHGIGLARARRLARANGGDVFMEADDSAGTTFVFTIGTGAGTAGAA